MRQTFVALGNFFFRHRNWSFPLLTAAVFALAVPPSQTFGSETAEHVKDMVAVLIAATGLILRALVIGTQYVRRSGENRTIHANTLFTSGMFSLCRNPLYTGNILIVFGIFLMHGNPLVLTLGAALFVLIYMAMVRAEEAYLRATFGVSYLAYCAATPRWLPNPLGIPQVLRETPFSGKRVLLVEYTNIGITAASLIAAELYEELAEAANKAASTEIHVLLGLLVLAVVWIAAVRFVKKRRLIVAA